jgi:hypothetical protein
MRRDPDAAEPVAFWLDIEAAARFLGREPGTLRGWRTLGKGPVFHLVSGRFVRYRIKELQTFRRLEDEKTSDRRCRLTINQ